MIGIVSCKYIVYGFAVVLLSQPFFFWMMDFPLSLIILVLFYFCCFVVLGCHLLAF